MSDIERRIKERVEKAMKEKAIIHANTEAERQAQREREDETRRRTQEVLDAN
jgi:hypothetical protein